MNNDDNTYIEKLKDIKQRELDILDSIDINNDKLEILKGLLRIEKTLVDHLIEERERLSNSIKIDPLSGLYNRRILSKIRNVGTVIMCNIDYFKNINDTYGHNIGDKTIKSVGESILDNIRVGDVGCRYGGDEFLIVFTTDRKDVIEKRIKKIVEDINKKLNIPGFDLTLSVGVAFNEDGEQLNSLIEKADEALYSSKENGRNQITYYGINKEKERLLF